MRVRSFPFTSTFVLFLVICWFPLLEFDLNWNYLDWDQSISNQTGTNILDTTEKLSFQRVPGIQPGWDDAHSTVRTMLESVKSFLLDEYEYEWKYETIDRVSVTDGDFHVNSNVGGYIARLYPKALNITGKHKDVCLNSNMDSVYQSDGFSANALGVTQLILMLQELASKPGLKNPVVVIISDTRENGSNVLINLYSLPKLKSCVLSIILDSLGVAQTVPEILYTKNIRIKSPYHLPRVVGYYRTSNYILDTAGSLSLLTHGEISLISRVAEYPSIIKYTYVDNPFYHHTREDQRHAAEAAAAKARFDAVTNLVHTVAATPADHILPCSYGHFFSYISVFGITLKVSSAAQWWMVVIGITLSFLFLHIGNLGQKPALQAGTRNSQIILVMQIIVYCVVLSIVILWLTLAPLSLHQLNVYIFAVVLCILIGALVLFTLQMNFYMQYFTRDYTGGSMSIASIIYGCIAVIFLLFEQHSSLNFALPCLFFGLTNLPLFLRKIEWLGPYKCRKILYAIGLVLCALFCYLVNMGSACATLHVTYGKMSANDFTVCVIVVFSFWAAVFPAMFTVSNLEVIYMVEEMEKPRISMHSVSTTNNMLLEDDAWSVKTQEERQEKVVYRRYVKEVSVSGLVMVIALLLASQQIPIWNSDKPARIYVGVEFLHTVQHNEHTPWVNGHIMVGGHTRIQQQVADIIQRVPLGKQYSVSSVSKSSCYLQSHINQPCLQVDMMKEGKPVIFNMTDWSFNITDLKEVTEKKVPEKAKIAISSLEGEHLSGLTATNMTKITKRFRLIISHRDEAHLYGYPHMLFRIYTTNLQDTDSKVYSNPIEVEIKNVHSTARSSGYVLTGTVMANLNEDMEMELSVTSRAGSQVIIRLTDVAHFAPEALEVLGKGLGDGFVFGGMSGLSFMSFTTNYFVIFE